MSTALGFFVLFLKHEEASSSVLKKARLWIIFLKVNI
jgi:hypothetical protein